MKGYTLPDGGKFFYNSGFDVVVAWRHGALGLLLLVFLIIDYRTFAFYPLQKGLRVHEEERSAMEKYIMTDANEEDIKEVYNEMVTSRKDEARVSYWTVLRIKEV